MQQKAKQSDNKRFMAPIAIGAACILLFIYMVFLSGGKPTPAITEKAWNVAVIKAQPGTYRPTIRLNGVTESPRYAVLEAAITADVLATPMLEGDIVKTGETLIKLDQREAKLVLQQREAEVADLKSQIKTEEIRYQSDLLALENEKNLLTIIKREVSRQETLMKRKLGSASAFDLEKQKERQQELKIVAKKLSVDDHTNRMQQLAAKLKRAEGTLGEAKLDLERTKIVAPFNGRITKVNIAVGNRVQKSEKLTELFDTDALEVRAQIPSQYVGEVSAAMRDGKKLIAYANSQDADVHLELARLAGQVTSGRGGIDGLFKIIPSRPDIPVGFTVELTMQLPAVDDVYRVPSTAIYGRDRIYVLNKDRMQAMTVQRIGLYHQNNGNNSDNNIDVLIKSPELKPGVVIITTQLPNARSGLKVNPTFPMEQEKEQPETSNNAAEFGSK